MKITWTCPNLRKFTEMMFFFSEMFPKFFGVHFNDELDDDAFFNKTGIKSVPKDANWEEDNIKNLDAYFDDYMEQQYEDQVLKKLFENKNVIDYQGFYAAINGSSKATRTTSHFRWIFNTSHLRKLLLDKFEADKNLGTFSNAEMLTEGTKKKLLEASQGSPAEDNILEKFSTD